MESDSPVEPVALTSSAGNAPEPPLKQSTDWTSCSVIRCLHRSLFSDGIQIDLTPSTSRLPEGFFAPATQRASYRARPSFSFASRKVSASALSGRSGVKIAGPV
ncbi:hypothetical protein JCM24511_06008 [Saitozyma sp. JCM 24511]|nr:hypothetical protein JCM24511_06008 [Saitozyma sp. JCM 24511]